MRVEDLVPYDDRHVLTNGAVLVRKSGDCEVCIDRNEVPGFAAFECRHEGMSVNLCHAHAQELLDMNEDKLNEEGGIFKKIFG